MMVTVGYSRIATYLRVGANKTFLFCCSSADILLVAVVAGVIVTFKAHTSRLEHTHEHFDAAAKLSWRSANPVVHYQQNAELLLGTY